MPWRATDPMHERVPCLGAYLRNSYTMTDLCERFGMRRNTGYQWVRRSTTAGLAGLQEKPRAPHHGPPRLAEAVEAALLEAKRAHPPGGPRTILPSLARRQPDLALPAPSTAGELFRRAGLRPGRQRRRGHRHPGAAPLQAEAPHAVWTADFQGQFRTGDGLYCYPLTVADADSRLLLSWAARRSTTPVEARPSFERLFHAYDLPAAIRTDNGAPFAPPAFCGLSQRSVWGMKRGIRHQRLAPGRPEQHGAHERMHRTLQADATRPPERQQSAQQAMTRSVGGATLARSAFRRASSSAAIRCDRRTLA